MNIQSSLYTANIHFLQQVDSIWDYNDNALPKTKSHVL